MTAILFSPSVLAIVARFIAIHIYFILYRYNEFVEMQTLLFYGYLFLS